MCGISVIVKKPDYTVSVLEQFNATIAHRGPDGAGIEYFDVNEDESWRVGLAHRRLSILDLSAAGKQPMSYSNGDLWITFNGEVYNYIELKNQLKAKGYAFSGNSDTEVILAAYHAWGTSSFEKLRGMWGFVIYDRRKELLIACRDRMGIKPLYYFIHENYIAFGSEIKQFLTLPEFVAKPDRAVVKQYILTGFERTDRTFFNDILPLLPGTYAEIDASSLKMRNSVSFWNPEKKPTITDSKEAAIEFGEALNESIRIHLRSDVPVGCQLSGGLDSSAVFSFMQQHYTGDGIHSFTVQFPGYQKDETPFVNRMLAGSKALSHFVTPEAAVFREELRNFLWHHDEPVGSFSHYAGFVLARLIAQHQIKVVLNGQGGDEILGGYWQQYFSYLLSLGKQGRVDKVFGHLLGALGARGNEELFSQIPTMWRRFQSRNQKDQVSFTSSFTDIPSLHFFGDYFSMSDEERRIFEIRNLILPRLLKWDDRNLMAFGIEGRYPFLDHEVMETALSFDSSVLFKKGWTKHPLRMAMENRLPKEISFRKSKWGFETPQQDWLRGTLRPMLQDWVGSEKPIDQVIERSQTEAIANRFWKTGSLEDAQSLLRLFLLDQWFHIFSIKV